jgi:hypothetical protein
MLATSLIATALLTPASDPAWAWARAMSQPAPKDSVHQPCGAETCGCAAWAWALTCAAAPAGDRLDKPAEPVAPPQKAIWARDPRFAHVNRWVDGKIVGAWFAERSQYIPFDAARQTWGEPAKGPRPTADELRAAGAVPFVYPTTAASSHAPAAFRFAPAATLQ